MHSHHPDPNLNGDHRENQNAVHQRNQHIVHQGNDNQNENGNESENGNGKGNGNGNGHYNEQHPLKEIEIIFNRQRQRITVYFFKNPSHFYLHVRFNTGLTFT